MEAEPNATVVAGATDVGLWVTKRLDRLSKAVFLHRVEALKAIEDDDDRLILGAGVTHAEALDPLAAIHPDLEELWDRFAGAQVRAVGTIGGNIANGSPIGDSMPALIALGARVLLRKGATTRTIALEDLYLSYGKQDRAAGEFVVSVEIDKLKADAFRCYKVSKRREDDISAVMGAFRLRIRDGVFEGARIAFGGMAGVPARATNLETAFTGRPAGDITRADIDAAIAADFQPLSDQRASADYRLRVAGSLAHKVLLDLTTETVTRLDRREVPHAA